MVVLDKRGIRINDEYKVLLCSSMFYFRIPQQNWEERVKSLVSSGYNTVDVYFPWNFHEIAPDVFDFEGDANADEFLKICKDNNLMIIARPGPYICSEWDGGGLPAWITAKGSIRKNDRAFIAEVEKWYSKILPVIRKYEYDGKGGVILLQLENELDFFDCDDPAAYIGALRDIAINNGIGVPMFACAGQYSAAKAGGLTEGVVPTFNFYPDSSDTSFDGALSYYTEYLSKQNLPLLISETHRDIFTLRRELAGGAKLLGAYNQTGGSDFGFTQSVNNWGKPLAFLTTLYDFSSMINPLGEFTEAVNDARIFAHFLELFNERVSSAVAYKGKIDVTADFRLPQKVNALELNGGGVLVCVSNFSGEGDATVSLNGKTEKIRLKERQSAFIPFNVKFGSLLVESASCEPLAFSGSELIFHTDYAPHAVINGKEFTCDGEIDGVKIRFISEKAAAVLGHESDDCAPCAHEVYDIENIKIKEKQFEFTTIDGKAGPLDSVGAYRGYGMYHADVEKGKPVFVENVSDIITSYIDDGYYDSRIAVGTCEEYPVSKSGKASFLVEKWGNCNFDDPGYLSLRLTCRKGLHGVYSVMNTQEAERCSFKLFDDFGGESIDVSDDGPQVLIGNNSWNCTRLPVICGYSFTAKRSFDKLYINTDVNNEICIYVDGKLAGRLDYGYLDLTAYCPKDRLVTVTAVYRKKIWTEHVGKLRLIELKSAAVSMAVRNEAHFTAEKLHDGKACALPKKLEKGKQYLASFTLQSKTDCLVDMRLTDCKATVMTDKKVIARIMGEWDKAPLMTGGSQTVFFLPSAYLNDNCEVLVSIECVGENPAVDKITITNKNI